MSHKRESASAWAEVEEVFFRALDAARDRRAAVLDEACEGKPGLRTEVEAMLLAHEAESPPEIEALLDPESLSPEGNDGAATDPLLGTRLGSYRVLDLLGEGGMARVYLGERDDNQYRKRVAIKVTRSSRFSAEIAERFRLERQVLASLRHPNIATLLDGGVTVDGRPYLVMDYVEGRTVTEYCDGERLSVEQRLRLFSTVCDAVQYAHSHLVVHRDLKPSNILVAGNGAPQLLDFGIAKLLDPEQVAAPLYETRLEARLLTPLHAAPEQLCGQPVTTATDVYALGVLLYQLLVGRHPYQHEGLREAEIEQLILTSEPDRPTTAVEESAAPLRQTTRQRLVGTLRGDLERITLKALRKEPPRRYASAGQLAEDIGRYLDGQPVLAQDDTLLYRARRFMGRHRLPVAASLLLAASLSAFAVTATLQAGRLATERDRAEGEQAKAEEVVATMVDLFEAATPAEAQGDQIPVERLIAHMERRAESLAEQPAVQARLFHVLGRIQDARGQPHQALETLERAWLLQRQAEPDLESTKEVAQDHLTLEIQHDRAKATYASGQTDLGLQRLEENLAAQRRKYGSRSERAALAAVALAVAVEPDEAMPLLDEALSTQRELLHESDIAIAATLSTKVMKLYQIDSSSPELPKLAQQSLEIVEQHQGPNHPHTLAALGNLASVTGNLGEREALEHEIIERSRPLLGANSKQLATRTGNLGVTQTLQGKHALALETFREAYDLHLTSFGETHPRTANAARNVARSLELTGSYGESLTWFERVKDRHGLDAPGIQSQMSVVLARLGRHAEAVAVAEDAIAELEDGSRRRHLDEARLRLARVELASGTESGTLRAATVAQEVLAELLDRPHLDALLIADGRCIVGLALVRGGRADEARPILQQALPPLESWGVADPVDLAAVREFLAAAKP